MSHIVLVNAQLIEKLAIIVESWIILQAVVCSTKNLSEINIHSNDVADDALYIDSITPGN